MQMEPTCTDVDDDDDDDQDDERKSAEGGKPMSYLYKEG